MNKKQLAGRMAEKADLSKIEAERMIDVLLGEITEALTRGEKITIGSSVSPGFVPGINLKKVVKSSSPK